MQVIFNIPDNIVDLVNDAFGDAYKGWFTINEETGEIIVLFQPNQWSKIKIIDYIKSIVKAYQLKLLREAIVEPEDIIIE